MNFQNISNYFLVLLLAAIPSIQSCQMDPCGNGPEKLIANMEGLVKDVKNVEYKPKDDRWKKYDDRFEIYSEECYDRWSSDMTGQQKRHFAVLVTRYVANRFGRSIFRSLAGEDGADSDDPEFLEKLGDDIQRFMEKSSESGKDFMDDLKSHIEVFLDSEKESK